MNSSDSVSSEADPNVPGHLCVLAERECSAGAPEGARGTDFGPGGRHDALGAEIPGGENHDGVRHGHGGHRGSSEVKTEK